MPFLLLGWNLNLGSMYPEGFEMCGAHGRAVI